MFTLKDFMLAEMEGRDAHAEMMQDADKDRAPDHTDDGEDDFAHRQNKAISLVSEIRQIMNSLVTVGIEQVVKDPKSFTFIDVIEALNTTGEIIRDRLEKETVKLDNGEEVDTSKETWQGDHDNDYSHLFNSINHQIKETIRNIFISNVGSEQKTGVLPHFVQLFNTQIVDRLTMALEELGPEEALRALDGIIDSAKDYAVLQQKNNPGDMSEVVNLKSVNKYWQARKRTIGKKHPMARTSRDRLQLNKMLLDFLKEF